MSGIHERTGNAEPAMLAGEPGGATERDQQPAVTETSSFSGFELPHHGKKGFFDLNAGSPHQQNYFVGKRFLWVFFFSFF